MFRYLALLILAVLSQPGEVVAQDKQSFSALNAIATSHELSRHPVWLKLIHYEKGSSSRYISAIHSPEFFLSEDGRVDPEAELKATLLALLEPLADSTSADHHAQCVFRARFYWLIAKLQAVPEDFPDIPCQKFDEWTNQGRVQSISIVYATGFLDNPASYYGHTLLKFNTAEGLKSQSLLDMSINFGAIGTDQDDPISYISKGMFGGYEGGFSDVQFYFHNQNYSETELRDLWEYELNLSEDEVKLVMAHAWEVLGKKYTYYFLERNCVYRMAEMLEIVEGVELISNERLWLIPQAVMQNMGKASRDGEALVRSLTFHPSRQSRFYNKFYHLDQKEQSLVRGIAQENSTLMSSTFTGLPLASKHKVLDTLLDYYQVVRDEGGNRYVSAQREALKARYQLPVGSVADYVAKTEPPHEGRRPSFSQAGMVQNDERGQGLLLSVRPAYYDRLDSAAGHVQHAELAMGKVVLASFDEKIELRQLQLLKIQSVNGQATGMPGDDRTTWGLELGLERQNLACEKNCLVPRFSFNRGYTRSLGSNALVGAHLGGGLQNSRNEEGYSFLESSIFASIRFPHNVAAEIGYRHHFDLDGSAGHRNRYSATLRYPLNTNVDLRFSYLHGEATEAAVRVGYYW